MVSYYDPRSAPVVGLNKIFQMLNHVCLSQLGSFHPCLLKYHGLYIKLGCKSSFTEVKFPQAMAWLVFLECAGIVSI